ncbi:heme-binding protein [Candidatus Pelagibacter ubique]|jgi:effector-binding domain-containing protein|nr:heme-binding protein [Candidatus Pelagibacter ubique]MDC0645417.1 heme-binding protein [Candidatus Pelagibacter ubique]
MKKFLSIVFLGLIITSNSMSYEEANYEVVKKNEVYEIRKYSDRLAIETDISNEGNSFRKLFNYISGNNDKNEEIKMTTPVTQIEKKGNMTMQFYLPSRFNKENIPSPSNPDVKILNIKGGYYAVIRYSGRASDKNFIKHKSILENELKKDNMIILSPPIKATYDGPFTLPMNRRNEAMFEINIKNKGEI